MKWSVHQSAQETLTPLSLRLQCSHALRSESVEAAQRSWRPISGPQKRGVQALGARNASSPRATLKSIETLTNIELNDPSIVIECTNNIVLCNLNEFNASHRFKLRAVAKEFGHGAALQMLHAEEATCRIQATHFPRVSCD